MANNPPSKAYENLPFLRSRDARTLRILAEYQEPHARLRRRRIRSAIVFFGSSSTLDREQARKRYGALAEGRVSDASEADIRRARHQLRLAEHYEDARAQIGRAHV